LINHFILVIIDNDQCRFDTTFTIELDADCIDCRLPESNISCAPCSNIGFDITLDDSGCNLIVGAKGLISPISPFDFLIELDLSSGEAASISAFIDTLEFEVFNFTSGEYKIRYSDKFLCAYDTTFNLDIANGCIFFDCNTCETQECIEECYSRVEHSIEIIQGCRPTVRASLDGSQTDERILYVLGDLVRGFEMKRVKR